MWELVACGFLIVAGIVLTYFFYGDLKAAAELSKEFNDLDKKTIKAAEILHDLLKEEKR
jgi:5-bromo-4-chloroindolyl phosphate hydrolysis protein